MDKKNRRYEIQSNVRVPNMDDIQRAASDFSEAREELKNDFIARNAKHFITTDDKAKYVPKLNEIKEEMVQLAMVVASEEKGKSEPVDVVASSDDIKAAEDDSVPPTSAKTEVKKTSLKNTTSKPKAQ